MLRAQILDCTVYQKELRIKSTPTRIIQGNYSESFPKPEKEMVVYTQEAFRIPNRHGQRGSPDIS